MKKELALNKYHRFLDEAGDTTFYGKGKINIIGNQGVSKCFILGMVKFSEPLKIIRNNVIELQKQIANDPYYKEVPSIQKKIARKGFYFHATDDIPEVREKFFKYIMTINCSFEAVVGKKIQALYQKKHHSKEAEFYADLLSHLLMNKLGKDNKLILNIAKRGKSTKNNNLQLALSKSIKKFKKNDQNNNIKTKVIFNVQNHHSEPLLNIADYFCWSIQRIFERGETRYYNFIVNKITSVVDLYNYEKKDNAFTPQNKLSSINKISPLIH